MPLAHGRSYSYAENSGDAPREDTMITRSLQVWRFGARRKHQTKYQSRESTSRDKTLLKGNYPGLLLSIQLAW